MSLRLTVISYKDLPPPEPLTFVMDKRGGAIGRRSPESDLVLPDPEKFVSRRHAVIDCDGGQYVFRDISTGGSYFIDRDLLLRNDALVLKDGERFKIGEYELRVQIVSEEPQHAAFEPVPTSRAAWPDQPESLDFPTSPPPQTCGGVSVPEDSYIPSGPQLPSFVDQPDVAPQHAYFRPPDPAPIAEQEMLPEFDVEELFRDVEPADHVAAVSEEGWQIPDDFFGTGLAELQQLERPGEAESSSPPFTGPSGEGTGPASEGVPPASDPATRRLGDEFVAGLAPERGRLVQDEATPPEVHGLVSRLDSFSPAGAEGIGSPSGTPAARHVPMPSPPAAATAESRSGLESRSPAGSDLFRLFLEGAGLQDLPLTGEEQIPELMKTAGLLFRSLVEGIMTALQVRTAAKRELRVSMTTMRATGNNPLKSTPNASYAMSIMLTGRQPGFSGPEESVREGFCDLMNHQMATAAGIQASLQSLLKRFDPQTFERRFEEGIVFQKKAKCWDAYCKAYPELVNTALEDLFGDEFVEVYEQQMQILRSAETQRDKTPRG